jgi:hypothetical protein
MSITFLTNQDKALIEQRIDVLSGENASLSSKLNGISVMKPTSEMVNIEFEVFYSYIIDSSGTL